jgi:ABC-type uncharacterized transport system substrate-binding protein
MAGVMMGILLGNPAVQAHPHYWIDVLADWQFNRDGMITGVKLSWLFDDYYSVLLASDVGAHASGLQATLDNILSNTAQHHYFIRIEHQGAEAELGVAEQAQIGVRDHRIEVGFLLPIAAPLDPRRGDIVYRVAEPTYYFEMLHAEDVPAITFKDAPAGCRYRLQPPSPDAALVAYAASLGIDESGGDELGMQFAETVTIRCE